jgi:hypothetical protein
LGIVWRRLIWFEPQFAEFVGEWSTFGSGQFEDLRLAAHSWETGIYLQSIASRSREIAADIQEMAQTLGKPAATLAVPPPAAGGMAANSPFPVISA